MQSPGRWALAYEIYIVASLLVLSVKSPVTRLLVGNHVGKRTEDNFFEFRNGAGFDFRVKVKIETALGR